MKFACDSCQTKYTIPDEKVRGKVLKIRCKKCGAVITVKEEVAPAPEPEIEAPPVEERTRVADIGLLEKLRASEGAATTAGAMASAAPAPAYAAPPPSEANEAPTTLRPAVFHEWYAMIGGQQAGPISHAEMEIRVKKGEVTERTHVWRDGMGDWLRAADVQELKEFFGPAEAPPPPEPPAPPPVPSLPSAFDDEDVPTRLGDRPNLALLGEAGLFADEGAPADDQQQAPPDALTFPPEPQLQQEAQRPNLADLVASDLEQHAAEAGALGSGPVDMGTPQADPFAQVPDAPGAKAPVIGEQTRFFMKKAGVTNRNPWWKYAIFVVVLFALPTGILYGLAKLGVGGTVAVIDSATGEVRQVTFFSVDGLAANTGLADALLGKHKATAEQVAEAEKKKNPPKAPKPVTGGPTPKPGDNTPDRAPPTANLTPEEQKKLDLLKEATKGDNPFAPIVKDPTAIGGPSEHKKEAAKGPDIDKSGGALTAEQINKVVSDTQKAFNACVEEELRHNPNWKGGKVVVSLAIKPSGTVSAPTIDKKDVDASTVGDCIKTKAKRMVFPRFEGEDQPVEFPLILTNGG